MLPGKKFIADSGYMNNSEQRLRVDPELVLFADCVRVCLSLWHGGKKRLIEMNEGLSYGNSQLSF